MQDALELRGDGVLTRLILDVLPLPVFVVDASFKVVDFNASAERMLGTEKDVVIRRLSGEVLGCLASFESGCGNSEPCKDCVVRKSVTSVFSGEKVTRHKARMEIVTGGQTRTIELLVTATPFVHKEQRFALLILEDISEVMALRGLLPICAKCKKIRDDGAYWHRLEEYLSSFLNVNLTHGLCPQCAQDFLAEDAANRRGSG